MYILQCFKQYTCNDNTNLPLKQCFTTDIKTEMESKIPSENYGMSVNQHLYEHNYFLIGMFNRISYKHMLQKLVK